MEYLFTVFLALTVISGIQAIMALLAVWLYNRYQRLLVHMMQYIKEP